MVERIFQRISGRCLSPLNIRSDNLAWLGRCFQHPVSVPTPFPSLLPFVWPVELCSDASPSCQPGTMDKVRQFLELHIAAGTIQEVLITGSDSLQRREKLQLEAPENSRRVCSKGRSTRG